MAKQIMTPEDARAFVKSDGHKTATIRLVDGIADAMLKIVKAVKTDAHDRIEALERRVAELEAKPSVAYKGVWQTGQDYRAGDAVTRDGSLWIAKLNHLFSEPGHDFVGWQLAVKRGKDGRDSRDGKAPK